MKLIESVLGLVVYLTLSCHFQHVEQGTDNGRRAYGGGGIR